MSLLLLLLLSTTTIARIAPTTTAPPSTTIDMLTLPTAPNLSLTTQSTESDGFIIEEPAAQEISGT